MRNTITMRLEHSDIRKFNDLMLSAIDIANKCGFSAEICGNDLVLQNLKTNKFWKRRDAFLMAKWIRGNMGNYIACWKIL